MRNHYLRTVLSPAAVAEQVRSYGHSRVPVEPDPVMELGPEERAFIAARDSFYLASVTPDGWPYVQHRGGPAGFLQVLSGTELAFADYNGNRQLVSTGNVRAERRVALFLMDYAARERLKILGTAQVLGRDEEPSLTARLPVPARAVAERVFRIRVVGFDWNCPKYITPRFTAEQVSEAVAPLRARIAELERSWRQGQPGR